MNVKLKSLEDNVSLLIQLYLDSRIENRQLREALATSHAQCEKLNEKIHTAANRLEALLLEIPNNE